MTIFFYILFHIRNTTNKYKKKIEKKTQTHKKVRNSNFFRTTKYFIHQEKLRLKQCDQFCIYFKIIIFLHSIEFAYQKQEAISFQSLQKKKHFFDDSSLSTWTFLLLPEKKLIENKKS